MAGEDYLHPNIYKFETLYFILMGTLNQLVIEKVENGYIITAQIKKEIIILFGGNSQVDKLHYIASSEEDLITILSKDIVPKLVKGSEVKMALKKESDEDEE